MNDKYLWDIIDGLRDELNIAQDGITDLNDVVKDLQAEAIEQIKDNKRLNDKDGLYDEVKELQAEIKELQADYEKQREYIIAVEKENDILKYDVKHKAIKIHQDRIPKEYKAEADEYFHHNPKSKGVRFHMIDFNDYDYDENDGMNGLSGEYNSTLYADDCIVEIDNS